MSKDITFQLDTEAAAQILQSMAMPLIRQSANAWGARAQSMASSTSSDPPEVTVTTTVDKIKRGQRAIGTIAVRGDEHQLYIGRTALIKASDAARV